MTVSLLVAVAAGTLAVLAGLFLWGVRRLFADWPPLVRDGDL